MWRVLWSPVFPKAQRGDVDEAPLHMLTQRDKIHMSLEEAIQEMAQRYQDLKARGKLSDKDLGTEPPVSKL